MKDMKKPESVNIQALTWNMGNKEATKDAVEDIFNQLDTSAIVLSISTQEELAPDGKRLVDLLRKKLEEKNRCGYQLVERSHTTMAGANNSAETLLKATLTEDNRVRTAILVKSPYFLHDFETRIDYQPPTSTKDKNEQVNKSVITVQGKLMDPNGTSIDISVSGGHFDANQDQKRRSHANKFLEKSGMKTNQNKTFDEIYQEASAFKIVTGDFNERNQLFGSEEKNQAVDMMKQTNFKSYGFDVDKKPEMTHGNDQLKGTYGIARQDKRDTKTKRKHVAQGGFLDRVAYTSGLQVTSNKHGFKVGNNLDEGNEKGNKKGKLSYHGSDHLPVLRSFKVTPPDPNDKQQIVADYIKRRIPDFEDDINNLVELIRKWKSGEQLKDVLNEVPLRHYDSDYEVDEFISIYAGIKGSTKNEEVIEKLNEKLDNLRKAQKSFNTIKENLSTNPPPKESSLTSVFNRINKCHDFKNALQEINDLPEEKMTKEDKADFMRWAGQLVDKSYVLASTEVNNNEKENLASKELSDLLQKYNKIPVVEKFIAAHEQVKRSLEAPPKEPSLKNDKEAIQTPIHKFIKNQHLKKKELEKQKNENVEKLNQIFSLLESVEYSIKKCSTGEELKGINSQLDQISASINKVKESKSHEQSFTIMTNVARAEMSHTKIKALCEKRANVLNKSENKADAQSRAAPFLPKQQSKKTKLGTQFAKQILDEVKSIAKKASPRNK